MMQPKPKYGRRIGNAIEVTLYVRATNLDGDLAGHVDDISLTLQNETKGRHVSVPFTVAGNEIRFVLTPEMQRRAGGTGVYTPILAIDAGGLAAGVLDWWCALEIVPHTAQEYSCAGDGVYASDVSFTGELSFLAQGLLAYDAWLADGNSGSLSDYVAWMRRPALDAAESLHIMMLELGGAIPGEALTNLEIEQILK